MGDEAPRVVVASSLDAARASMLREMLESAGISARSVEAMPGMSGAEVAVSAPDAERALEIARSAGFLGGPAEPVEIPYEEWSRGAGPDETATSGEPSPRKGLPPGPMASPRPFPWGFALGVLIAIAALYALSKPSLREAVRAWLARAGNVRP